MIILIKSSEINSKDKYLETYRSKFYYYTSYYYFLMLNIVC